MTEKQRMNELDVEIEYHADDYGLFPTQSRRILGCHTDGRLNGVSVMPNSPFMKTSMMELKSCGKDIAVSVHLNLIEGRCLSEPAEVPLLVSKEGVFRLSFGKLLLCSFLPVRTQYRRQLRREISAQIQAVRAELKPDAPLRIDGHAHYHMLPVAFDALMDVIREEKLDVSYIRLPREHVSIYLRHWREFRDFSFINLAKVAILNLLVSLAGIKYGDILDKLPQKLFLGVLLSGCMYRENVDRVLPEALRLARKKGLEIEILAHPGGVYEPEDIARITFAPDEAFLTSEARIREASLFSDGEKKQSTEADCALCGQK